MDDGYQTQGTPTTSSEVDASNGSSDRRELNLEECLALLGILSPYWKVFQSPTKLGVMSELFKVIDADHLARLVNFFRLETMDEVELLEKLSNAFMQHRVGELVQLGVQLGVINATG